MYFLMKFSFSNINRASYSLISGSHFSCLACFSVSQGLRALESTLSQTKPQTQCDVGKL